MEVTINQSSNRLTLDPALKNIYSGGTQLVPLLEEPSTIARRSDTDRSHKAHFSLSFLSRSSSVAMIGGLLSQGLKFLVIVFVARRFSVSEFGLLSFALAVNAFQFVITNFGLHFFGSRAVAQSGFVSRALLAEICFLRACLALITTAVSVGALAVLPSVSSKELLLIAIFGLSNVPLAGLFDWAFQGLHRQEVSAILNVLWQGSWLILTLTGIWLGMGVLAVPVALAAATAIAALVGYYWLERTGCVVRIDDSQPGVLRRSWRTLKSAVPLGGGLLLNTSLVWIDAVVVRFLRNEQAVGLYAAGNRAGLALAMLASYYVQGAFPLLSRASHEGLAQFRAFFQHCYQDMALLFVPGSLWAIFYAREIISFVFKRPEYVAAVPVFQVFQIVFLVISIGNLYGIGALVAFHRDRDYRRVFASAGVMFIPLCVALTLYRGIVGASLAVLVSQVFSYVLFAGRSRDLVRAKHGSALALPIGVGLGVVMASRFFGLTLLGGALMISATYAVILGNRFRGDYAQANCPQKQL